MSVQDLPRPKHYKPGTGVDRYARFAGDWIGLERTKVFDTLAKSLVENEQTLAVGGNGLGKSYSAAALGIAALYCNPNTVVPVTAGNGDTLKNSIWKPIKSLWRNSQLPTRIMTAPFTPALMTSGSLSATVHNTRKTSKAITTPTSFT